MLTCIKNTDKNNDAKECYDQNRLFNFEDKTYIKNLCNKFYGEVGEEKCEGRGHFCNMCCNHFIGVKHEEKLEECKKKCDDAVRFQTQWRGREVDLNGKEKPKIEPYHNPLNWRGKNVNPNLEGKDLKDHDDKISPAIPLLNVSGNIVDASTGQALPNEKFEILLINKTDRGENPHKANIDGSRFFFEGVKASKYKLTAKDEANRWIPFEIAEADINNDSTRDPNLLNVALSPVMNDDYSNVVLTWGEKAKDLDAILQMEKEIVTSQNKKSSDGLAEFTSENHKDGRGPETIKYKNGNKGSIHYYVENKSNEVEFKDSGAVVRVYTKDKLVHTLTAPKEGNGKYWHVFSTNKNLTPVNKYVDKINY